MIELIPVWERRRFRVGRQGAILSAKPPVLPGRAEILSLERGVFVIVYGARAGCFLQLTHANGSSGCTPSDSPFDQLIRFENATSRLKPGCAENAIVRGFLEMMQAHQLGD